MHVCLFVLVYFVYVCVCVHARACVYAPMHVRACTCVHTCTYICMHTYMQVKIRCCVSYSSVWICASRWMYTHISVCSVLNRVLEPSIIMEMTLSTGSTKVFEVRHSVYDSILLFFFLLSLTRCLSVLVCVCVCVCVCVRVIISLYGWGYFCVCWYMGLMGILFYA